ncbi:hypothetical protein [Peribacillus glennii]|uniref:Uncharacterized protein n=1 Tax=Peribacillus glennii TaxID=2303991 RepID=A0A372LI76_9BACI|nr:hypothetical protein [Peribacillus glennii]RFU65694.1 hypothetical protein D0466_07430 [Peribacillus glennii]
MQTVFAIELAYTRSEFPDLFELLAGQSGGCDIFGPFLIVGSRADADFFKEVTNAADSFVDSHELLSDGCFIPLELFSDYGFQTNTSTYLFKESLSCFRIASGGKTERGMALLELDEILIASWDDHGHIHFFVDEFQKDLVLGLAKAYDIEVSFLHLDKY